MERASMAYLTATIYAQSVEKKRFSYSGFTYATLAPCGNGAGGCGAAGAAGVAAGWPAGGVWAWSGAAPSISTSAAMVTEAFIVRIPFVVSKNLLNSSTVNS